MPARRAAPAAPALTDSDVDALRRRLSDGEAPRVVVRSASAAVPAGTRGTVVRLGDPSQDEYVVVRLGRDEVPFSPSELSLPGAKPKATPAAVEPDRKSRPAPEPAVRHSSPKAVRQPSSRRRSSRSADRKPPPPLTVTLKFAGGRWTAEATRGSRRLARPAPLRPGAVSALADHVDDETLHASLVETVEACRAVVEAQAAELREQLQAAEAALRDYNPAPRR